VSEARLSRISSPVTSVLFPISSDFCGERGRVPPVIEPHHVSYEARVLGIVGVVMFWKICGILWSRTPSDWPRPEAIAVEKWPFSSHIRPVYKGSSPPANKGSCRDGYLARSDGLPVLGKGRPPCGDGMDGFGSRRQISPDFPLFLLPYDFPLPRLSSSISRFPVNAHCPPIAIWQRITRTWPPSMCQARMQPLEKAPC
jgi:hypothetical protein